MKEEKTNIFIIGHTDFEFDNIDGYKKILVGADNKKYNSKFDYLDNQGDNISSKNKNYCELTGVYWIWKNLKNVDNIGICHYRRILSKKKVNANSKYFLSVEEVENILKDYDLILPAQIKLKGNINNIYEKFTKSSIKPEDIENTKKILEKKYPEYLPIFDDVLDGNIMSYANILVTKTEIYSEYCEWLFDILFEVEQITDYNNRTSQQMRVYGYLSEILLNVWVIKKNLKVKYYNVVKLDEKHNCKFFIKRVLEIFKLY